MAVKKETAKKPEIRDINLEYGKVPPQAIELEEAVLGAIMLEKDSIITVLDILQAEYFYVDTNKKIYSAIVDLSRDLQPIDILTVTEKLKEKGELEEVGGPFYITQLTGRIASAAHIDFHARIITQKFIQRELIRISSEIQEKAFDSSIDVDDLLDFSEKELFNIAYGNIKKETARIDVLITEAIKHIEEVSKREDGLSGVPSGFSKLDRLTSGWQRSDLVVIAGRPSMGKTAFVLSMAKNIAVDHNRPLAFFSLEMSSIQLVNRMIVSETELAADKIRNGNLQKFEWEQLEYKIKNLVDAPIFIDDTPAISVFEFRAKCRRLKIQHNIEIAVIDYLQLMSGSGDYSGSREQEVSTISRSLKAIAKELNIPIIALSQLNRSVEMRSGDKRPQLSDLRESGAIEQDADLVIFIHRPERYGLTEDEYGQSTKGLAEIIVSKHRNGPTGDIRLKFRTELAQFSDIDESFGGEFPDDDNFGGVTFGSKMNIDDPGVNKDNIGFKPPEPESEKEPF